MKAIGEDQMRDVLRQYIQNKGSLTAAADSLSTDHSLLSKILAGERTIGDSIASQLGFALVKKKVKTVVHIYIGEVH